jgi:hypothetical protein
MRGRHAAAHVAPGSTIVAGAAISLPPKSTMALHHRASRVPIIQRASDLTEASEQIEKRRHPCGETCRMVDVQSGGRCLSGTSY